MRGLRGFSRLLMGVAALSLTISAADAQTRRRQPRPAAPATQTLESALARAYNNNPTLNSQRAALRVTNEGVPQALSNWRPRASATADIGASANEVEAAGATAKLNLAPRGVGLQLDQTLFDSGRTTNAVSRAESNVLSARETLRLVEQQVLLTAATVYMDVLRDTALLNLNRNNVEVLDEQLRQTQDRFNVGEVTRTDVAQAQARVAQARSGLAGAEAALRASLARYRQTVGVEPTTLAPGRPVERSLPRSLEEALRLGLAQHPELVAALHAVDAADATVKATEAELLPTVGVRAGFSHRYDQQLAGDRRTSASIVGTLTIPLYEGGATYSRVRQAKEDAGRLRLAADIIRDRVRASVIAAWSEIDARVAQITAAQAQVQAAETALAGVREEANVGQRTTLDVLNAQQELLTARSALITAQRDRVVASYTALSTIGRLGYAQLGLRVQPHDARLHYQQVRDKWIGLQTPDGR